MQKLKKQTLVLIAAFCCLAGPVSARSLLPGSVLVLYDSTGEFGWIGGMYSRMLANLLGHFPFLPYEIMPVEAYRAGDVNRARATFYFGSVYQNPLPDTFKQDVLTTANPVCWFKYNVWQLGGPAFEAKTGFRFNWLDWTGYSNIVYKGESFLKNQLDPELGYVTVLNPKLGSVRATAVKPGGASIPYVTVGRNFWYVADVPFGYISEEDRYIAFADLLHDIVGIDHPPSKTAIIRIEDVSPRMYDPDTLRAAADLLYANRVPFAIALVPVYSDPLGYYNYGIPELHRISDGGDPESASFLLALRYMMARGGQLLIHGYTHQYGNAPNPYTGCTGDDFEFWRVNFNAVTPEPFDLDTYAPVPEDSTDWVLGRLNAAKRELADAGLSAVGFEAPHYAASPLDYQVIATNFPLTMHRVLYFDDHGHIAGQMFPYEIHQDIYGQSIIPENLGNVEPEPWFDYPVRLPADMIRAAEKNLVVRDGWACGYFHPFFDLRHLRDLVKKIKLLGYTYLPVSADEGPSIVLQPASQVVADGGAASFAIAAVGTDPKAYQWRLNGADITGANATTLTIPSAQLSAAGNYTATVSNAFGVVTSAVAGLSVQATAPVITTQPGNVRVRRGQTAAFTVMATGTAPLAYQWRFNSVNVPGATSATLTIVNAQTVNAGSYSVVVSNVAGQITSKEATLTVR